jgi:hypothetical protein
MQGARWPKSLPPGQGWPPNMEQALGMHAFISDFWVVEKGHFASKELDFQRKEPDN